MSDDEENTTVPPTDPTGGDTDEAGEAEIAALLNLSKKKKKKKTTKPSTTKAADSKGEGGTAAAAASTGTTTTSTTTTATSGLSPEVVAEQRRRLMEQDLAQEMDDPDDAKATYTYEELLDRAVGLLQANNPDLVDRKRTRIKPPQLQMVGSRKTLWVNFQEICSMMKRDPLHVYSFLMAELGTEGSIDGNERLIIRGRYLPKYIESLLRKYVIEYVTCEMCRSPNTDLVKDQSSRLYFCNCRDCGSKRSVATVRTGYHATSRADRRAARNAKG